MHKIAKAVCSACLIGGSLTSGAIAHAQEAPRGHRIVAARGATPEPTYRGLTVTRPPEQVPDQDLYEDGPTRYNDIRDFSPSPYVTSGVQFPYGLDGVGGYGMPLGGGSDAALYDRGAITR